MKKKLLCLILALTMICAVLIACNDGNNPDAGTVKQTDAASETVDPVLARYAVEDDLPEMDLGGAEWRVYAQEHVVKGMFYVEDQGGEVVNDAIFYSNRAVEERFNVDLVVVYSGMSDDQQPQAIKELVSAGDDTYSLVACHDALGSNLALENTFYNLNEMEYLNYDKPWWHNMDAITILDQAYMISSDMTIFHLNNTWVIYFNKDLMDDFNITYPYQQVLDNTWTFDRLIEMTRDVYSDVNGNTIDDAEDIHGYSTLPNCYGWLDSMGIQTTVKDDNEILKVLDDNDKMATLVSKMYTWLFESVGARSSMENNNIENQAFMDGRYMMLYAHVGDAVRSYRYVENFNYGFVPTPKYDEQQENYISTYQDCPFFVPNVQSEAQLAVTGLMIEALSAQGYRDIFPSYYEIALKVKYSQDDESMKMIEIINDASRPPFSWCVEFYGGLQQTLYTLIMNRSSDYASHYARTLNTAEGRVKVLIRAYEKMADNY